MVTMLDKVELTAYLKMYVHHDKRQVSFALYHVPRMLNFVSNSSGFNQWLYISIHTITKFLFEFSKRWIERYLIKGSYLFMVDILCNNRKKKRYLVMFRLK